MKQPWGNATVQKATINGKLFFIDNGIMWPTWGCEWRKVGTKKWYPLAPGGFLHIQGLAAELKVGRVQYFIDEFGWEEVAGVSIEEMLKAIVDKIELLEYRDARMYAMLKDSTLELGCRELRSILISEDMVTEVHHGAFREIYRINKDKVKLGSLAMYPDEIKKVFSALKC